MHVLESIKNMLAQWFRQLSSRDQRALVVLLITAVVISLYGVRSNLAEAVDSEQKRNAQLSVQLQQMKLWAGEVKSGTGQQAGQLLRKLSAAPVKGELTFSSVQPTSEGVAISANNIPQQQFYRWLEKAQLEHFSFVTISVRQANSGVAISAVIEAE